MQLSGSRSYVGWGVAIASLSLILVALFNQSAPSQTINRARIVEILEGSRRVDQSNQAFLQNQSARRNAVGERGQQLRTKRAKLGVRLNEQAGIRLDQDSSLIIGNQCVQLDRGQVLLSGKSGRGCVGSIVAVTRGTIYIMELSDTNEARVTVLEGAVDIFNVENPTIQPVSVQAGQRTEVSAEGIPTPAETLSQAEVSAILTGPLFADFQEPLPGLEKLALVLQRPGFASTFLRDALTGADVRLNNQQGQALQPAIFGATTITGIFTRTSQNAGFFQPANGGPPIPITLDFNNRTISFGSIPGVTGVPVESSLGLSGSQGSGTVYFSNGQVVQVQANTGGIEPPIQSSFPGSLTIGTLAPDR